MNCSGQFRTDHSASTFFDNFTLQSPKCSTPKVSHGEVGQRAVLFRPHNFLRILAQKRISDAPQLDDTGYCFQQCRIVREKFENKQTDAQMRRKSDSCPFRPTFTASS
jgi:hypothetical protein